MREACDGGPDLGVNVSRGLIMGSGHLVQTRMLGACQGLGWTETRSNRSVLGCWLVAPAPGDEKHTHSSFGLVNVNAAPILSLMFTEFCRDLLRFSWGG